MDPPPYTDKDKGFTRSTQLSIDGQFKKPTVKMEFVKFLQLMLTPKNLDIIKREVNDTKGGKDGKRESRGTSDSLQGSLEMAYGFATNRCRSDTACLLNTFEKQVTKTNVFDVLREYSKLIENLFPVANSDASYRVQVRNVILKTSWGTETFLDKIKSSGVFAISSLKKEKRIREANDKLEFNLRHPEKLNEAKLLRGLTELKKKKTIHDKILLVQVCIGSRFTEVLFISEITLSNLPEKPAHTYIRVYGVGKEQRESRRKNLAELKAKRRKISEYQKEEIDYDEQEADQLEEDNRVSDFEPKEIIKPVLFNVTPAEIVELVAEIRAEIKKKVSWYDTLTREDFPLLQKLANLYLQKAVDRVDELFGYRHTHLMRRIYAYWSWETWGRYDMAQLGWYKAVLGHTSSNTSRAYTTLLILPIVKAEDKALDKTVGEVLIAQSLLTETVTALKEEIKQLHTFSNPPQAEEGQVDFWANGKWATVTKAPNENVADPVGKVEEWAQKLEEAGVEVTKSNLRKVGFGSRIINDWWLH